MFLCAAGGEWPGDRRERNGRHALLRRGEECRMSLMQPLTKALIDCREASLVGGKAANLGRLARMGFAVPDGFALTTRAYRLAQKQSFPAPPSLPLNVAEEIRWAYHAL